MAKGVLKLLDMGVLLTNEDEEYDAYNKVYTGADGSSMYGFYDESQTIYKEKDMEKAIKEAVAYVKNGVDKTYAVITNQGECNYSEPLDTEDIEGMTYEACDIEYSVAKINGNIVEAFLYGIGETGKI